MKILIAGGAGYIGTMLSNKLADDGHEITVVDLFWFGDFLNDNVKKIKMNLIDLTAEQVSEYEAVVFMAGLSNDPMANFSPKKNFIENAAAPTYLSYICKKAGVKRFVYASSCSVYGFTDNKIMTEQDSVGPEYPYGISKLQTEFSIMNMESENFRPISLRKGTVGGWSPRMRFDLVVNTMTKYALTENRIVVHNPNLWRPLVDIRDAVQAYEKSIFCDLEIAGIFNISHSNYTIGELATNIKDVLADRGHDVQIETQNNPDVRNYLVSNDKARDILGYSPKYAPKHSVGEILDNIAADIDFKDNKYYNIATFREM